MNILILTGRLTRDPEVRNSANTEIAKFTLAVDGFENGEKTADFFDCVAFGNLAKFAEEYLKKGTLVNVCGRLKNNNYTDRNGNKQYTTQVVLSKIEFGEAKKKDR
jgi:single-strand DNA-binding protein